MTQKEALETLELRSAGANDALAVRRAYLRQLKMHTPEKDPEGFRRVREAYEFLLASLQRHPGVSRPPRASIALRTRPTPDKARLILAQLRELADGGHGERSTSILRGGPQTGFRAISPELLARTPSSVSEADFRRAASRLEPEALVRLGIDLLRKNSLMRAAHVLALAARAGAGAMDGELRLCLLAGLSQCALTLVAAKQFDEAHALMATVLPSVDSDELLPRGVTTLRVEWTLAREIVGLPKKVPREVQAQLAAAILSNDPAKMPGWWDFPPPVRRQLVGAPLLLSLMRQAPRPPKPPPKEIRNSERMLFGFICYAVVAATIHSCQTWAREVPPRQAMHEEQKSESVLKPKDRTPQHAAQ